jgi:hypothetical protein
MTAETIALLIENELTTISDPRVVAYIRSILVEPHIADYGQQYPCWTVLKDPNSVVEIAYCDDGFEPKFPWGLVGGVSMKTIYDGYTKFLEAFFESLASVELPVWRVFRVEPDKTRAPITDPGEWDAAWARVYELRSSDPTGRYECGHSVEYGR